MKNFVQKIFTLSFAAALVMGLSGTAVMAGKCKQCAHLKGEEKKECKQKCKKEHSDKKGEGGHRKHHKHD